VNLPQFILRHPHGAPRNYPQSTSGEIQTGANISQVFLEASKFLHSGKSIWRMNDGSGSGIMSARLKRRGDKISYCKLALTKFFDLSNIRAFAGGPVKMFGASRCFLKTPFQFDGQPALGADLPFECDFFTPFLIHSKNFSRFQGEQHLLARIGFRLFCLLGGSHGLKA